MKPLNFPLSPVARVCAASLLCGTLATFGSQAFAATEAGTEIKNLATVTYEDAAGNVYSAQSNEAVVTVAQVYFAEIGTGIDITGAAGQTVYLPYVLSNTGNGTDVFAVSAADYVPGVADPAQVNASDIKIYRDTNGNGQPDAGEPILTSLSLLGGESVDIVVAVQVPTTATAAANNYVDVALLATAEEGTGIAVVGSVDDLTPLNGTDTTEGTVQGKITVTNDAVLAMTKTSSHDVANSKITYTVTVSNNGNTAAKNVVLFDGLPEGTTIDSFSSSGLLGTNGDTLATSTLTLAEAAGVKFNLDADESDGTETTIGLDLNNDGVIGGAAVPGVWAKDAELAPNATISMTITVSYLPLTLSGGKNFINIAHLTADINNDLVTNTNDVFLSSNATSDVLAQSYAVDITDTDAVAPLDTETLASAASGGVAAFDVIITNNGNGDDTFELSVAPGTFPPGTVFSYYDTLTSVQLSDTNGFGAVDSGVIVEGGTRTIQVRAKLPQGVDGVAGYNAVVTATSAGDPAAISDDVTLALTTITAASADIHAATGGIDASDENPIGVVPYVPVTTFTPDAGTSFNVPVFIDNESDLSDSYVLNAGSSFDGTTVGDLPAGWSVQFFLDDGAGNPTGPAISSTPTIPGNTLDFKLIAVVTVPADTAQAGADVEWDAGNGLATLDANADSDGDYPLFLQIISANSGATDAMLHAVDVNASRAVAFTPSSSNQVEPGGTVDYPITLSNNGNSPETLELTTTHSQTGFNNTVAIDTDGDGIADTVLGNLSVGPIIVGLPDGTTVTIQVVDGDGDSIFELVLPPGVDLPLTVTVFAPATAPAGQTDTMTLLATNMDPALDAPDVSVSFQSDVINGQVRLTKTAAVDAACTNTPDTAFEAVQTIEVEPNECVIWSIVAENQGDVDAMNVTITDGVPAFTTLEAGDLYYCLAVGCTPALQSDTAGNDSGEVNGTAITFFVGTGADGSAVAPAPKGGTLVPGQKAFVTFMVRVD